MLRIGAGPSPRTATSNAVRCAASYRAGSHGAVAEEKSKIAAPSNSSCLQVAPASLFALAQTDNGVRPAPPTRGRTAEIAGRPLTALAQSPRPVAVVLRPPQMLLCVVLSCNLVRRMQDGVFTGTLVSGSGILTHGHSRVVTGIHTWALEGTQGAFRGHWHVREARG
jgi:hypothetical protein